MVNDLFFIFLLISPFLKLYFSQSIVEHCTGSPPPPVSEKLKKPSLSTSRYYPMSEILFVTSKFFRFLDRYFKYFNIITHYGTVLNTYNNII